MTLASRPYVPESDLASLIRFVMRVRPPMRLADYPSPIDLPELLTLPANQARTRLWLNERGDLTGYGMVDHFDNVLFDVVPGPCEDRIMRDLLDWAEGAVRIGRSATGPISLDTSCRSEDGRRVALLMEKGFTPTGVSTTTLVRSLHDSPPEPIVPPGWTIRQAKGETEVEELVALHRAAFGTNRLTVEERLAWMRAPHYIPELDLVLETNKGHLAGYCMCGIERDSNKVTGKRRGYTDPVAVHPKYRGLGGARALISQGMALLAERGMTEAVMNTSSENVRMLQVASSLGYKVESKRVWYSKALG